MLQGGYTSVLGAQTRDEFLGELVRFSTQIGFAKVGATTVIDHFLGESEFITVDNSDEAYRLELDTLDESRRDPVAQHCKTRSVPIIWNQDTYARAGHGERWEAQARYGYCTGVALALHMPDGRHFFFGVDSDRSLPADPRELTRVVADVQLFAVLAQDAAQRIFVPPPADPAAPALTPRELEVLRWTMEGKTAWEVGAVLGISERTAVLHVQNAMRKLDCVNKHQAVLKALRLGLIR